jgi:PEP-CTERM motif
MRYQFLLSLLLLGGSVLRADQFSFTYSGEAIGITGMYNVTETGTLIATNDGNGLYSVTSISGTRDGDQTISGLVSGYPDTFLTSNSGLLAATLDLSIQGVGTDLIAGGTGLYAETLSSSNPFADSAGTGNLSINAVTHVPEPSTLLIFLTLGVAVWALGRKLPTRASR